MTVDELVSSVKSWAAEAVPGCEPTVCALEAAGKSDGVFLSFLGFRAVNDMRNAHPRRNPVVDILEVDLLLTIAASDPLKQARLLAEFHFAALQGSTAFFLVADARDLLRDFGAAPDRSLVLRGRIARERAAKAVPPVREAVFALHDLSSSEDSSGTPEGG